MVSAEQRTLTPGPVSPDVPTGEAGLGSLASRRSDQVARWKQGATRLGMSYRAYRWHMLRGEKWCSGHRKFHDAGQFNLTNPRNTLCRAAKRAWEADYFQRRKEQAS